MRFLDYLYEGLKFYDELQGAHFRIFWSKLLFLFIMNYMYKFIVRCLYDNKKHNYFVDSSDSNIRVSFTFEIFIVKNRFTIKNVGINIRRRKSISKNFKANNSP